MPNPFAIGTSILLQALPLLAAGACSEPPLEPTPLLPSSAAGTGAVAPLRPESPAAPVDRPTTPLAPTPTPPAPASRTLLSDAGTGGAAGSGALPSPSERPPCSTTDSQLVVVGDSYLNWLTHDFPNDLERELGHPYRFYAEPGASMASGGFATPVPDQLANALAEDPNVLAAVMTGGGNDILLSDTWMYPGSDECKERADSPTLPICQEVVAAALDAAKTLTTTGAEAGIRDIVYVYYPRIPGSLLGIFATNPNEILDYASPMARAMCEQAEAATNGALRCHFLDLQPIFDGHPEWFADDGIHENAAGSAVIAAEVVKLMKSECIAQPAESGCCAP